MISKFFKHKESIALVFSLLAIIISGLSFYYSVREVDFVVVRAVSFAESSTAKVGTDVELVFSNGGNLPYLISKIEIATYHGVTDGGYFPSLSDERFAEVPFVLDKGAMKMLRLTVPLPELLLDSKRNIPVHLVAEITAVDVHGQLRKVEAWYGSFCLESETITQDAIRRGTVFISDNGVSSSPDFNNDPCAAVSKNNSIKASRQ
ncbi:hypothetical protein [Pseudomonas fluorescens]|uniref:hypothetical protein n=1 Tax=Pseudomonas fluorescens TaxID=294 RepID=UPI0012699BCD|nr:hypothetical protein [Pseudomonas fluorescens]